MKREETTTSVVVVDDEKYICSIIAEALSVGPYKVETFVDPQEAMKYVENTQVDLVLTDLVMGNKSGIDILDLTLQHHSDAAVIIMTAHPTVQAAISVLKKGAYDFLIKPFKLDILKSTIDRALKHQRIVRENIQLKEQLEFLKLTRANIAGTEIDEYLSLLVATCKREFSAAAVCLVRIDPDSQEILGTISEKADECCCERMESLARFEVSEESQGEPIISRNQVEVDGRRMQEVMISQPIYMRRKLYGVINILVHERFGTIHPGQIDLLAILTDAAASALANDRLYRNLKTSYLQAIKALANAIEARDHYTAGHTDRVCRLAEATARYLGWNDEQLYDLVMGCTLHDVGKIGVPDSILNKPGKLSEEETRQMRNHPIVGLKIIQGIDLFRPAVKYIESHHEWYDGTGYPQGLKGDQIPIEGRLLAIVDTFDAIVSDRPYRKGASVESALKELLSYRGRQFDPELIAGFFGAIRSGNIQLSHLYEKEINLEFLDDLPVSEMTEARAGKIV